MIYSVAMNDELTRLEAERAQFVEMARSNDGQTQLMTNVMKFVAITAFAVVLVLLASAVLAEQLSMTGFFVATVAAGLLYFILSRKLRSGTREVMVFDVLNGLPAQASEDPIRAQIAKHEKRIADLKASRKP